VYCTDDSVTDLNGVTEKKTNNIRITKMRTILNIR